MVVMVVLAFVVMVLGKVDIEVATSQAVGGLVGNRVGKAFGGEGRKGGIEFGAVGTEVEEGGDGHVTADTAGTVKIEQGLHGRPFDWRGGEYDRP